MSDPGMKEQKNHRLSGFAELCGMQVEDISEGYCKASCELQGRLLNPYGIVHGGATNTLMDTAAGIAAIYSVSPPRFVVTRSADVHYLRPIRGERMTVEARTVKAGQRICLVKADAYDDNNILSASGYFEICYIDNEGRENNCVDTSFQQKPDD